MVTVVAVVASALWLYSDLKHRISPKAALGVSFGLMILLYFVGSGIAGIFTDKGTIRDIVGIGSTVGFSTVIARPVSTRLRRRS